MGHNRYKSLLRSRVEAAISQARAAQGSIGHRGVMGKVVEILVKELFRPLLPVDIGVGTGQIIENQDKRCSREHDVILYDKSILPPILYEQETGLFPIESVLYTIEIKTTLTAQELKKAHVAAKELNGFGYLPGQKDSSGKEKHHRVEKVRSVIFALSSDLSEGGKTEAGRYKEIYGDDYPFIRALCVAEKEYWHETGGIWVKHPGEAKYDEVLSFIGGVMNTYAGVAESRGRPCLGHYVIDTLSKRDLVYIASGTENIVEVRCPSCGHNAVLSLGNIPMNLNVKDGFNADIRCVCGGKCSAPGGRYEIRDHQLVRVGEYEEA